MGGVVSDKNFNDLKNKVMRYESFMNSLDDLFSQSQDNSVFDKFSTSQDIGTPDHSSISNVHRHRIEEKSPLATPHQFNAINFQKIKEFLLTESKNEQILCSLLQALRWRITRTRGAAARREAIINYSKHDILDIKRDNPCVLERIMSLRRVGEFGARFINALASDYSGRTYLLDTDKLVVMFIKILKEE
eukprot:CAMPEP_0114575818 /NCGR_PEP_ID=MMETSP0125-20121206/643_1 /TAXON_ID=485358 ORGANISM="Aristerostoma sp., Strain ATCC 50986" /NCGR_SAMPLE_ID=MMETSP0125 /ASSEMBLY_ACC=CAM_ASM_000245 /LENGTH=189 /DNA_ID=CAMNT_0001763839 /DNA_START=108 /DNA_END=677 /DNA_ORIENTATION=-